MYRDRLEKSLAHRREQLSDLLSWLDCHDGYIIQCNFSVPQSSDHTCVTISKSEARMLKDAVIKSLNKQIDNIANQL